MYKIAVLVLLTIIALLFVMKKNKKQPMEDGSGEPEPLPPVSDPVTEAVEPVDE